MNRSIFLTLAIAAGLAACGGNDPNTASTSAKTALLANAVTTASDGGQVQADSLATATTRSGGKASFDPASVKASQFLAQASFGPTMYEIEHVSNIGMAQWLDDQFEMNQTKHRYYMEQAEQRLRPGTTLTEEHFYQSFWKQAIVGSDQLRQRVVHALAQIFVVSFQDGTVARYPRGVACYYDMLGANAMGNFRQLLEGVATSPMMGLYLSHLQNRAESETSVPDENFAREIMQLMTIGLNQLNQDGSTKLSNGQPIPTYSHDDVVGLAKVFTGWSWGGSDRSEYAFTGDVHYLPDDHDCRPMSNYAQHHSTSEKRFLGKTVAAGGTGESDLKVALDTLFNHPNVGPFIGRQLIQRLVTSNPSPAYVARVAQAFNDNGSGVRGDMKAVLRAILLDSEARSSPVTARSGKLREPVLRLANWARAFNARSQSGSWVVWNLEDPLTGLGQNPMRSPSVFNFFRPNYTPPSTPIAAAGLTAPEMQITNDTAVIGYLNFIWMVIPRGFGLNNDIRPQYAAEFSTIDPDLLINRIDLLLLNGRMSAKLRAQIRVTLDKVDVYRGEDGAALTQANRVYMAIYLAMSSPEYLVQK